MKNNEKGDLKYAEQSLFQMSSRLSKALGKRVTLVGEKNAKGQKNAKDQTAEKLDELWPRLRDRFGLGDEQDFSVDPQRLLDYIRQQADTRWNAQRVFGQYNEAFWKVCENQEYNDSLRLATMAEYVRKNNLPYTKLQLNSSDIAREL